MCVCVCVFWQTVSLVVTLTSGWHVSGVTELPEEGVIFPGWLLSHTASFSPPLISVRKTAFMCHKGLIVNGAKNIYIMDLLSLRIHSLCPAVNKSLVKWLLIMAGFHKTSMYGNPTILFFFYLIIWFELSNKKITQFNRFLFCCCCCFFIQSRSTCRL